MRPVHLAQLDKTRPAVILTRELARPHLSRVTVATITSTIYGLSTEVAVGRRNGLDHECVISCDNIQTVPSSSVGRHLGYLFPDQETALADAIVAAFALDL